MGVDRREPVKSTCPTIDKAKHEVENLYEYMFEVLEELRDSNGQLRDWGNELVCELEEIESKLNKAEEEIEDLKNEIENLR